MSAPILSPPPVAEAPPTAPTGRRACRGRPPHPAPATPSRDAKQRAAVILEVLAGARTPRDAAAALGLSLSRYYLLEAQGLRGLLATCEPAPRGRPRDDAQRVATLERDCQRWQRECARQQALLRAAQRSLGLAAPAPPPPVKQAGKKRRRPAVRALQVVARWRADDPPAGADAAPAPS
jgi:hypothetical protein